MSVAIRKIEEVNSLAEEGKVEELKQAIQEGVDIHAMDGRGLNALHWACMRGHLDVVDLLLQHDAKINEKDDDRQWAPLHWAASNGHLSVVKRLMEQGADVNIKDRSAMSPLHWAVCRTVDRDVVQALVTSGADVNACNWKDATPLHGACETIFFEAMEVLVNAGANLHARDIDGATPLHVLGQESLADPSYEARFLLSRGADVNAQDACGRTPLQRMAQRGSDDTLRVLVEGGADVNAQDRNGTTALHEAVNDTRRAGESMVEFLLDHGADPTLMDGDGHTPDAISKCEICTALVLEGAVKQTRKELEQAIQVAQPQVSEHEEMYRSKWRRKM